MFASFLNSAFCCFSTHDSHRHNCNKLRYMGHIHSMACPTQQRNEKENICCSWKMVKRNHILLGNYKKATFFHQKRSRLHVSFIGQVRMEWVIGSLSVTFWNIWLITWSIVWAIILQLNSWGIVPSKLSSCVCASSVSKHLFHFNQLV